MRFERRGFCVLTAALLALSLVAPARLLADDVAQGSCLSVARGATFDPERLHVLDRRAPDSPPRAIYRGTGLARGTILVAPVNARYAVALATGYNTGRAYAFGPYAPYSGDAHYAGPPLLPAWTTGPLEVFVWTEKDRAPVSCLSAVPASEFRERNAAFVLFIYLGSLAALLLFNLALAISTREPITGWYCAYLVSLLFYQVIRDGMPWRWFVPIGPIPENLFEFSAFLLNLALHAQFGRAFLQTRRYLRVFDRLLVGYMALLGVYFIYIFTADRLGVLQYGKQPPIVLTLMFFVAATLIAAAIARLRAGYTPALLFLISYPVLFFFTLLAVVHWATGIGGPIIVFSAEIGTLAEAVILSFAVGARLRNERELREFIAALSPPPQPAQSGLRSCELYVAIMQGSVLRGGSSFEITAREFELLVAMVIGERPPSRSELQEMLWPDLPGHAGENALHVALSRLRKRLGYRGAARSTPAGVVLDPMIGVDIRDARHAVRSADARDDALERACERFARPVPVALLAWDWFAECAAEIEQLRRDLLLKLIDRYERRGDLDLAIALAQRLQRLDPTDESGYAAAMRLYRRKGDAGGVARCYRDCRRSLQQHLGVEPSAELRSIAGFVEPEGSAPVTEIRLR
jgi:DNA-binding SARP family transcriptional activator